MPLPMSKTALDKLGQRMVASDHVADDDLEQFALVASACQGAASEVTAQLAELGYNATPRVKTTGTLTDKLRRQHTRLSQVQDLAGTRFVVPDRLAQDEAVRTICDKFRSAGYACKTDDLREDPSSGYRAVHVIVSLNQIIVEIQVRTELQDLWAQIVEDLGDAWGRGIRYGGEPENPEARIRVGPAVWTRTAAMRSLLQLSDLVARIEGIRADQIKVAQELEHLRELSDELENRLAARDQTSTLQAGSDEVRSIVAIAEHVGAAEPVSGQDLTVAEVTQVVRRAYDRTSQKVTGAAASLRSAETSLRDTLQAIASATDETG